MNQQWTRRTFLTRAGAAATGVVLPFVTQAEAGPADDAKDKRAGHGKRIVVIGVDGMDPRLCERMMAAGALPALTKLRERGSYARLGTSTPPQSPVAWASFITGAGPGVHGIFDFIHRDPKKQYTPYYSAAETVTSEEGWDVGEHRLPLTFWPFNHAPTQTLLRREGTPFWDYLDAEGVPTWAGRSIVWARSTRAK